MITTQKILDKVKDEMGNLKKEKDRWYAEFNTMKAYAVELEIKIAKLEEPKPKETKTIGKLETMIYDSKAAMIRYTEKLRKESLKYAKQK